MIKFAIILFGLLTCFFAFGQGIDVGKQNGEQFGFRGFVICGIITLFFIMVS